MKNFTKFLPLILVAASFAVFGCNPDDCDDDDGPILYKPNIYLYPEQTCNLTVSLEFPLGGRVITSDPGYGKGWSVSVDTNGLIDGKYGYLFYESIQPDKWQKREGWVIAKENLERFFRSNMAEYGFKGREIEDFTEYWLPRLNSSPYYTIYPQTGRIIENLIKLKISVQPNNVKRLYYLIDGVEQTPRVQPASPVIDNNFRRAGFYVTEWGVMLI